MITGENLSNLYIEADAFADWIKNPAPIKDNSLLFVLDAYYLHAGDNIIAEIIISPYFIGDKLTKEVELYEPTGQKINAVLEPFARGYKFRATMSEPFDNIIISIGGTKTNLQINKPNFDLFANKNTALLYTNGDDANIVAQWIDFHEKTQNLEAVCILRAEPWKALDANFEIQLRELLVESNVEILLIQTDAPLGADAPPQNSIWEAPDAPGKDRMEKPEHDFWRASLGTAQIIEILRWRYLNSARAVLNATPSDLYPRRTEKNLFDECVKSEEGYIQLYGERVFPWRVRKDEKANFGDHVVHRFDSSHRNKSWIVDPKGKRQKWVWNLFRIGPAIEDVEPKYRFWRFMGIRHQNLEDNNPNLAPKTALVLDEELFEFVKANFNANPVLPPEKEIAPEPISASHSGRRCIVTTMKNEGPFLLEWIAFHRAIGFDDFVIYTNDCDDGTDEFLDLLQERGIVEHYDNPYRKSGMKPQHAALFDAQDKPTVKNADWLICMDCDEYVDIKIGDGTLDALFEAVGDANFISLTWRLFGNGGVVEYEDKPIIEQFTACANEITRFPHQAWGVKTLYRNQGYFKKMGVHRPKGLKPEYREHIRWVNGSGKELPEKFIRNGWRTGLASYGYDLVQLNHYAVRSMESFLVKRDRGRVNHVERDQGLIYWFRMNHNPSEDKSIQRMLPKFYEEYNRLLSDPKIREQHEHCVQAHQDKINGLKARPDYYEFFEEINSEHVRKLSQYVPHFGMNVFLIGPEVVSPEILDEIDSGKRKYFNPPASMVKGDGHN